MQTGRFPRSIRCCILHNAARGGEAVRKAILAGMLAGLCAVSAAGCRQEEPPVFEPTAHHTAPLRTKTAAEQTGTAATTETTAAPRDPELDARLEALYTAEPVPIPEGGWTDETLNPVLLICGRPAETPFCLKNLLYGYSFYEDDKAYCETYADRIFTRTLLLHDGCCGMTNVFAADDVPAEAVPKMLDLYADWVVITPEGKERYPVSVNCVTIGSTADEVRERIGELSYLYEDDGAFRAECQTEHLRVTFSGTNQKVSFISVYDRTTNSNSSGK